MNGPQLSQLSLKQEQLQLQKSKDAVAGVTVTPARGGGQLGLIVY